jgi:hypothetical protein
LFHAKKAGPPLQKTIWQCYFGKESNLVERRKKYFILKQILNIIIAALYRIKEHLKMFVFSIFVMYEFYNEVSFNFYKRKFMNFLSEGD